jgi:hypothetical protein
MVISTFHTDIVMFMYAAGYAFCSNSLRQYDKITTEKRVATAINSGIDSLPILLRAYAESASAP